MYCNLKQNLPVKLQSRNSKTEAEPHQCWERISNFQRQKLLSFKMEKKAKWTSNQALWNKLHTPRRHSLAFHPKANTRLTHSLSPAFPCERPLCALRCNSSPHNRQNCPLLEHYNVTLSSTSDISAHFLCIKSICWEWRPQREKSASNSRLWCCNHLNPHH